MDQKKVLEVSKLHPLGVVCHAFSPDGTMLAASIKEENSVNIYKVGDLEKPSTWDLAHSLSEHSQTVSVLDWSAQDKILTGSHDRSVFVWGFDKSRNTWVPTLVIIQKQNRAILDGCWNANGNKFLIGTGSYKAYVGYYNEQLKWWDAYQVNEKKFQSSITAVSFHPSGFVVGLGSTDYSLRIVTAYLEAAKDQSTAYSGIFAGIKTFGEELFRIKNTGSWVENLQWNSKGDQLAAAVHNSSIIFLDVDSNGSISESEQVIDSERCPFRTVLFLSDSSVVAGGYDRAPISYKASDKTWSLQTTYSRDKKKEDTKRGSLVQSNLKMFESNKLDQSQSKEEKEAHTNPIICLKPYRGKIGSVEMFSTNDIHGNIFFWKVA